MTTEEMTAELAALQAVRLKLLSGTSIASISSPDGSIAYSRADVDRVTSRISALESALGVSSTRAYAPIYLGI